MARPVDAEGRPAPGALFLLFPAKGDRFSLQSADGGKDREGVHDLGHVRPGEHRLVALLMTDFLQPLRDQARFAALQELGQLVTVAAGERLSVDVVVRSLPEVR